MHRQIRLLLVGLAAVGWVESGWLSPASSQMGPMGGQAPDPIGQMAEPTEHGTKTVSGLEITLLAAPPLSPGQMAKMMPEMPQGMGEMKGMGPMGGMQQMPPMGPMKKGMGSMQGMGPMGGQPTHWIGVIVRDAKTDAAVRDLPITLTARKGQWTQTVNLMPMPGSYGANITLPGRGTYEVTVKVNRAAPEASAEASYDFTFK